MGRKLLGIIFSISLIVVIFFTSFEIAMYSDFDFYEKEYRKYEVEKELDMSYPDIMRVTRYMMDYLRGEEEVLTFQTTIEGEEQDFFNEQDRFHMGEVKNLFLGGYSIRRIAIGVCVVTLAILIFLDKKWTLTLGVIYQRTLATFMFGILALGTVIAMNFKRCFIIFHEIFFDNDLWLFDPATDYMIRMLPEGFFFDMVIRIGALMLILLMLSILFARKIVKKNKKNL